MLMFGAGRCVGVNDPLKRRRLTCESMRCASGRRVIHSPVTDYSKSLFLRRAYASSRIEVRMYRHIPRAVVRADDHDGMTSNSWQAATSPVHTQGLGRDWLR
jgi:hypothetical protein